MSAYELDSITGRAADLVAVPSVTGQEEDAIAWVADRLREVGGEVDAWTDSMAALESDPAYPGREVERERVPVVAARLVGSRPGPQVALTGHVDVVPPGDPERWSASPFTPRVSGGRLVGRGAADMKAGLAAALAVYEDFATRRDFAGTLWLVAVPGEEDGGSGTLSAIRRGVRPDAVIIPEPTAGDDDVPRLVVAHAGAITCRVEVTGCAAHAAFREEGQSALEAFLVLHRALVEAEATLNAAEQDSLLAALGLPYPTNVGRIEGGEWASTVMDRLVAQVRLGVAVGETVEAAERRVRQGLHEAARRAGGWLADHPPRVTRFGGAYRPAKTPATHPLVAAVQRGAKEAFGAPAALAAMPYGCDLGLWQEQTGAVGVVYGPGRARVAHTVDEWVDLEATARCARALAAATEAVLEGAT